MEKMLDLSNKGYERIFVTGKLLGETQRFMRFLYEQNFNYKDALVVCGDIIDIDNPGDSISLLEFVKANENCFAVLGDQEAKYLKYVEDETLRNKVNYQLLDKAEQTYKPYIENLPLIIKISHDLFSTHAGVIPVEGVYAKDPETYYMIGNYDDNSRFYQFPNPGKKNWYDFQIFEGDQPVKIIFSATETPTIEVPAGYSLYRSDTANSALKCMICMSDSKPIILEVK